MWKGVDLILDLSLMFLAMVWLAPGLWGQFYALFLLECLYFEFCLMWKCLSIINFYFSKRKIVKIDTLNALAAYSVLLYTYFKKIKVKLCD